MYRDFLSHSTKWEAEFIWGWWWDSSAKCFVSLARIALNKKMGDYTLCRCRVWATHHPLYFQWYMVAISISTSEFHNMNIVELCAQRIWSNVCTRPLRHQPRMIISFISESWWICDVYFVPLIWVKWDDMPHWVCPPCILSACDTLTRNHNADLHN